VISQLRHYYGNKLLRQQVHQNEKKKNDKFAGKWEMICNENKIKDFGGDKRTVRT